MAIVNRKSNPRSSRGVNFTIRVYGIFIKDGNILLSQEKFGNKEMLKFPGGGLEYGEGTIECLKRELKEEFNLDIEVLDHFYTTDFFVSSVFHPNTQVISIYYLMEILTERIPIHRIFKHSIGEQSLEWYHLANLDLTSLSFPIDQKVAELLKNSFP